MRLLLDGRLAPITSEIGFLELPLEQAVAGYVDWMRSIYEPKGGEISERMVTGSLADVLASLLPLVSVVRSRSLFVPTGSSWVAFFDNGWRGTDAFPPMSYLAGRLGCRGMRVVVVPDTMQAAPSDPRSRYGALIWEVYGPNPDPILNFVRTISIVHDNGWSFDQSGTPFPFEEVSRYSAKRKRDRLTFPLLQTYLEQFGMAPFEEQFYLPAEARLIDINCERPAGSRDYSLEEAQGVA